MVPDTEMSFRYKERLMEMEEFEHPYNDINAAPAGTHILIVGTCPPHRFCVGAEQTTGDVPFYYGSADNYLWNDILPKVFHRAIPATREDREEFLKHCKMWMFDIFQRFTRRDLTASDTSSEMVGAGDTGGLLRKCPAIQTICFTGATAEFETRKKLINDGLLERNSAWIKRGDMPRQNTLPLKLGRDLASYTLPSPNPRSAISGYPFEVQVQIYAAVLTKLCPAGGYIS
jgi:G:T/U-mismatch repair DNA glycosylase